MLSCVLMMLHDLANDGGYISLRWRTEMGGDTAKGCQKPALQQKTTDDDAFLSAFVTEERLCLILSISMFPFSLVA